MSTLDEQAAPVVANLLQSDDEQLYAELGVRAKALSQDTAKAGIMDVVIPDTEAMAMGPREDIAELGKRLYNRWSREAYNLMCGDDSVDSADRQKLVTALGLGNVALGAALSGALVSIGLAPLLAPVVAALIVSHFFRPGLQELCEFWKGHLPPAAS